MENKTLIAIKKELNPQEMILTGIIGSTGDLDRHGESVNPLGWKLDNFLKNPVILYGHNYDDLPVGKAIRVWIEDNALKFSIQFANTDFAKEVFSLFADGILNAFSVGFIPTKFGVAGQDDYTYMEQELLELSVVTVPANPKALAKKLNIKKSTIEERLQKVIETFEKNKNVEETKTPEVKMVNVSVEEFTQILRDLLGEFIVKKEEVKEEPKEEQKKEEIKEPLNQEETKAFLINVQKYLKTTDKNIGLTLKNLKTILNAPDIINLPNEGGDI